MAENIRLNVKGTEGFTTYHPETNFNQVLDSEGELLSNILVDATTTQKGLVQLTTDTTSTSVTTAATPKSVKDALDAAKTHTNTSLASLVNSAPETLDTLKEIADAIQATDGAVDGIISTIAAKAAAADLTSHAATKASLTVEGHVQLSNKTDGTSQILAATEKALNDVRIAMNNTLIQNGLIGVAKDIAGQNLNTLSSNGLFMGSNMLNAPTTDWYFIEHMRHNELYAKQIAHAFTVQGNLSTFMRTQTNGVWGTWVKVMTDSMRNVANGFVGLDGTGKIPSLASPDTMVAGTETKLIHTTDWRSHTVINATTTWQPSLAARFANLSGTMRVSYTAGVLNNYGTGWFNIYKNGIPIGTERSIVAANPQTFVEDIYVAKGDTIAIYSKFHINATSGSECTYIPECIMSVKGDVYRV